MTFITDFADQAVILPLVLAICVGLLLQGWRRGAAAWAVASFGTFSVMLVLKLMLIACAPSLGLSRLHTPSGHVAAATLVVGGLATLWLRRHQAILLTAVVAAAVIGFSRLALGAHSLPEVAIGGAVGLLGAWALLGMAGPPPPGLNARRIAILAAVVVMALHGLHLPAEAHIRSTAARFAQMLAVCQSDELRL